MQGNYIIRTMGPEEVPLAVDWAAAEGWNPGLGDAECFLAADREGFLVGLLDGEPVACISAMRYGAGFGFVGFYIVRPDQRGKGFGWAIWQAAMAALAGRTVGLDGVLDQQDNYRKSGFELAHRNVRYRGACGAAGPCSPEIVDLSAAPGRWVVDYDRPFFADDRARFVLSWISQPGARALGLVSGGKLVGYGVLRRCREGVKIGPLFADTGAGAEALFLALQSGLAPGEPLFLDVPEVNPQAVALARRHGMEPVFETARMYAGPAPALPLERIYGITTFELG